MCAPPQNFSASQPPPPTAADVFTVLCGTSATVTVPCACVLSSASEASAKLPARERWLCVCVCVRPCVCVCVGWKMGWWLSRMSARTKLHHTHKGGVVCLTLGWTTKRRGCALCFLVTSQNRSRGRRWFCFWSLVTNKAAVQVPNAKQNRAYELLAISIAHSNRTHSRTHIVHIRHKSMHARAAHWENHCNYYADGLGRRGCVS